MVSITLSVPEETRKLMKRHEEMNWSGFVRRTIENKVKKLEEWEKLKKKFHDEEKEISNWSVKLQKASRSGRLEALKSKGLI